jgi:predicted site-specific integrase-resolvase
VSIDDDALLTATEAADSVGVHVRTVARWAASGRVRVVKLDNWPPLYHEVDLIAAEYATRRARNPRRDLTSRATCLA